MIWLGLVENSLRTVDGKQNLTLILFFFNSKFRSRSGVASGDLRLHAICSVLHAIQTKTL